MSEAIDGAGCSSAPFGLVILPLMRTSTQALLIALLLVGGNAVGCNGSRRPRTPDEAPASTAATTSESPAPEAKPEKPAAAEAAPSDTSGFDKDMADMVLERGRKQAVQCPTVVAATPTGEGEIEIVFDGPSGKIVDVVLGTTFAAGSADGQACLKNAFLGQIVTRFEGKKKVSYTLNVPAPPPPEKATKSPSAAEKGGKKK